MPTFEALMRTHPTYDKLGWKKIGLVSRGGLELLDAIRHPDRHGIPDGEELLVKRMSEGGTYDERKRRAFVLPNMPHILGFFSASTLYDAPAVKEKPEPEAAMEPEAPAAPDEPTEPPEAGGESEGSAPVEPLAQEDEPTWYEAFQENVDRSGTDLPEFMRRRLIGALTLRCSYIFVDFPERPGDVAVGSQYEEDEAGLRDGYFMPVGREDLLDWERDECGKFVWAKMLTITRPLADPLQKRDVIRYEWRIFRAAPEGQEPAADGGAPEPAAGLGAVVEMYRLDWRAEGGNEEPPPETIVAASTPSAMRYSHFPLVEVEVPEGLWIGSKVYPAEVELLNKRNAKSWAEYISAFSFLLGKFHDEESLGRLRHFGDGSVKVVGTDEDLDWRTCSPEAITALRESARELVEEIHRTANALALAAPLGAIQQAASGEAKRRDMKPSGIVCRALGKIVRDAIQECFDRLAEGRGEEMEFEVSGLQRFDDGDSVLDLLLSGIDAKIPSDSALVELWKRAIDEWLPDAPPALRAEIEAEIEKRASQRRAKRDALAKATIENPEAMAGAIAPAGNGPPSRLPAGA